MNWAPVLVAGIFLGSTSLSAHDLKKDCSKDLKKCRYYLKGQNMSMGALTISHAAETSQAKLGHQSFPSVYLDELPNGVKIEYLGGGACLHVAEPGESHYLSLVSLGEVTIDDCMKVGYRAAFVKSP